MLFCGYPSRESGNLRTKEVSDLHKNEVAHSCGSIGFFFFPFSDSGKRVFTDIINTMSIDKERIKRFAENKFSLNDYLAVSSWFKKEESQSEMKQCLEEDWSETGNTGVQLAVLSRILDKLHHRISLARENSVARFYRSFSRIAALLLIPALLTVAVLGWLMVRDRNQVETWAAIHSPAGTRTQFQLPDGTTGWLNGGSSIKYPVRFDHRRVEISGEAWFDVVPSKLREFRVITPYFDVKVLGTRFDVVSYAHERTAEVILEQGKVQILGKDESVEAELSPDQHLVFDKSTKRAMIGRIDSRRYTSWRDGWLILKNEPMTEIARRLGRRYNAEIILHGDSLKSSVFRATFRDENLDEIFRLLSTVAPIRYRINDRKRLPDGTFDKSQVEMWLKESIINNQ